MNTSLLKTLLIAFSLLLPLGYAHAANDNADKDKGNAHAAMRELMTTTDEELAATYGNDKAVQIRAIVDEMKEHQQAMMQLRKQLAETAGLKGKGKDADKAKGKNKDKGKKNKNSDDDESED